MTETNQKLRSLTPAQYAFMKWLSDAHPNLLREAEERRASLNGFMDSLSQTFKTVMDKAPDLLNQYVAGKQQLAQLKINIERAKAGQYPIESQIGVPVAQAQSAIPWWAFAAGGAVLVYLLVKK